MVSMTLRCRYPQRRRDSCESERIESGTSEPFSLICYLLFAIRSPNLHALFGRTHHGTLVWNSKSLRKLRQITERSVDPKFRRAVRIDLQEEAARLPTSIVSPNLRPREEESLFGCEFIDLLVLLSCGLSPQCFFQSGIRYLDPA